MREMTRVGLVVVLGYSLAGSQVLPAEVSAMPTEDTTAARSRIAFSHALPRLEGDHLKLSVVEVTYGPGGSSKAHSHPCPVVGFVVEGALRTQVKGEPEAVYKAGESFYEAPDGVHQVSANASDKAPVRFIAVFVCDRETPLSIAAPETAPSEGK